SRRHRTRKINPPNIREHGRRARLRLASGRYKGRGPEAPTEPAIRPLPEGSGQRDKAKIGKRRRSKRASLLQWRMLVRRKTVILVVVVVGIFAATCCLAYYLHIHSPAYQLEQCQRARAEWLQIASSGKGPRKLADASVLIRCFKEGEPAADYSEILSTGMK